MPINRREFLKSAVLAGLGLVAASCDATGIPQILRPTETRTKKPTDPSPDASKTPGAIATKEATKGIPKSTETNVPNEVALPGLIFNSEVLRGFIGMGGEEPSPTVVLPAMGADSATGGGAEQETFDDYFRRISENWKSYLKSALEYPDLGSESMLGDVNRLRAANTAASGFVGPSTVDLTGRFPGLKDIKGNPLRLLPFQINTFKDGGVMEKIVGWPQESVLRKGTTIIINGRFVENNKDQYLLSYSEYVQRTPEDSTTVPRLNWLIVDRDQMEALVGEANLDLPKGATGLVLTNEGRVAHFTDGKTNYAWEINTIDKKLIDAVKATSGFMRVDMIGGQLAEKPIVPSPAGFKLPAEYETTTDAQTGEINVYAKENGKRAANPSLKATYNAEEKKWEWKEVVTIVMPVIEGLVVKEADGKTVYVAEAGNPYGLESGKTIGVYDTSISFDGRETGGLLLERSVVESIFSKEFSGLETSPKVKILTPVSFKEGSGAVLSFVRTYGDLKVGTLKLDFSSGELRNILPGVSNLRIALDGSYGPRCYDSFLTMHPNELKVQEGNEMRYISVTGPNIGLNPNQTIENISFGDSLSECSGPVYVTIQSANDWVDITPEMVVTLNGVPVIIWER